MRKRLRKKLHKGYRFSVAELRNPVKRDSLRKAAKQWLMADISKMIRSIDNQHA